MCCYWSSSAILDAVVADVKVAAASSHALVLWPSNAADVATLIIDFIWKIHREGMMMHVLSNKNAGVRFTEPLQFCDICPSQMSCLVPFDENFERRYSHDTIVLRELLILIYVDLDEGHLLVLRGELHKGGSDPPVQRKRSELTCHMLANVMSHAPQTFAFACHSKLGDTSRDMILVSLGV